MNRIRPLLLAALAVVAACGDSTGPEVVQVAVSPSSASLVVGASQQFTATAQDASGNAVTGVSINWATSDAGVASVDDTGLATGTGAGTAAITATISGVAGSSAVSVSAQQTCENAQTVSLSVGGSAVYDAADCIILPSGAAGDRYRVGVTWPTEAASSSLVRQVQLSVTGLGVSAAPEATAAPVAAPRSPIPGLSDEAFRRAMRISEATERFHLGLRNREAELVRRIGARGLLPRGRPGGATLAPLAASPAKLQIDTVTASSCETTPAARTTAVLVHENQDMAVYQDSAQRVSKPVSVALAQKMTSYYTNYSKDMVVAYWGEPSDIDGNGKLILFISPVASDSIAAFVWAGDFLDSDPANPDGCAASNEAEIIYFNADLILDMVASDPGYQALATGAHEAKHVVGLYDRLAATNRMNSNQFNPGYIEEGTAEISGEMSSRIAWAANGGPSTAATVTEQSIRDSGGFTEENYGVAINLARAVWFLSSQPNGLVVTPDGAVDGSSIYGSGWLFHRWLGDAYGNPGNTALGDAAFFRALTDSATAGGVAGIVSQTGKSFETLLREFYTTIMLHKATTTTAARPFHTYDFVSATGVFSNPDPPGDFPWPITLNGTETPTVSFRTAEYTGPVGASGIRIHDFLSNGTGTGAQIRVNMPSPGTIIVVRLR